MYVYGRSATPRKKHVGIQFLATASVILGGLAAAGWYVVHQGSATSISNSSPVTRTIGVTTGNRRQFSEPAFTFSVPKDWNMVSAADNVYRLQPIDPASKRWLLIHMDNGLPDFFPANYFLPVRAEGAALTVGNLSPDCTKRQPMQRKVVWQGAGFTCSMQSMPAGGVATTNMAAPRGATQGAHTFLIAYGDSTDKPQFDLLADVVRSLQVR